jgi:hypothetical protein
MNLELVTNLLQRNVPDFVNDQVKFWIDMAQEAIRRDEREKIVAWLRQEWVEDDDWGDWFAERIEAGAHLK